MPKNSRRNSQDWILDRFVSVLGIDALMPGFNSFATSPVLGFDVGDLQKIQAATRGMRAMKKEYARAGQRRRVIAERAEAAGHVATARRQFHLASQCFGIAQYLVQEDDSPLKARWHQAMRECYEGVCSHVDIPVHRVEIPFEDEHSDADGFPGLLHLPAADGQWPCVIFLPGTDMFKEQIPNPEDNIFAKRGLACLSLDGPGQGESLLRNLKVRTDTWNYERAVSAAIDYLHQRSEIDSDQIALFGVSTGSYWSVRGAVHEARNANRVKACAGLMAQWETAFVTEFEHAQPAFKTNYMYMAGFDDEDAFDRHTMLHTLNEIIAEVSCPLLVGMGEFDELCTPDQVLEILGQATVPYELRIYEDEFHPMGGVAIEAWEEALDWIADCLAGRVADERTVVTVGEGDFRSAETEPSGERVSSA